MRVKQIFLLLFWDFFWHHVLMATRSNIISDIKIHLPNMTQQTLILFSISLILKNINHYASL
jgi:hypothetical protein